MEPSPDLGVGCRIGVKVDADETTEHRPLDGHEDRLFDIGSGRPADDWTARRRQAPVRDPGRGHRFPPDCRVVVTTTTFGGGAGACLTTAFGGAVCPGLSWTYWMMCLTDGAGSTGWVTDRLHGGGRRTGARRREGGDQGARRGHRTHPEGDPEGTGVGPSLRRRDRGPPGGRGTIRGDGRHASWREPVPDTGHQSSPASPSDSPRAALATLWTVIVFCFGGAAT